MDVIIFGLVHQEYGSVEKQMTSIRSTGKEM